MKLKQLRDQMIEELNETFFGDSGEALISMECFDRAVVVAMQDEINITQSKKPQGTSEADKKKTKVKKNTLLMEKIGDWFGRRKDTLWTVYEAEALERLGTIPGHELENLQFYYEAEINKMDDIRRRSLETLLNNWNSELDRATEYCRKHKRK